MTLTVEGPEGHAREIEAVVDTGYNGFLTLPPVLVGELDLPFVTSGEATLANGSAVSFDIHMVIVDWDGRARHVEADAAETTPLVGMQLLAGHDLTWKWRAAAASSSRTAELGTVPRPARHRQEPCRG